VAQLRGYFLGVKLALGKLRLSLYHHQLADDSFSIHISEAHPERDVYMSAATVNVQRGIVNQRVDDVKTEGSARTFNLTPKLLDTLKSTKQRAVFSGAEDWIFASPIRLGRLPYSYTGVCCELERAASIV
jgi:hypothetical protein